MKKILLSLAALCFLLSCSNTQSNNHEADAHHEHKAEAHASHEHEHASHEHEHAYNHDEHHHESTGEIVISPEAAERAGIKSAIIAKTQFQQAIRCSGKLNAGSYGESDIVANISGILTWTNGKPSIGQNISKDQIIAQIAAATNGKTGTKSSAQIQFEIAEKDYIRATKLLESKTISEKEFFIIEKNYLEAKLAFEGIKIASPFSGSLSEINAVQGTYISEGQSIAKIMSLSSLRLEVQLNEKYLKESVQIKDANFRLPYQGNALKISELNGKLISQGKNIQSGYIPLVFEFQNREELVPGSFAEVWLLTQSKEAIAIDESAVSEEQGEYFVYIKLDDECYRKQTVKVGGRNGRQIEILSGLEEGQEIVVQGAYQVKLASATVIPGHTHNH